jgi:hypothetical protein
MGSFAKARSPDKGIQKLLETVGIGYVWILELGKSSWNVPIGGSDTDTCLRKSVIC